MRIIIFCLVIAMIHMNLTGQYVRKDSILNKNQLCIELGGAGALGSINYERLIKEKLNKKLLFRVGLSYLPLTVNGKHAFGTPILPFGLYYLIGVKHHLELGLNNSFGYTIDNISNKNEFNYILMPSVGYRFENFYNKSVYFNFAYSPGLAFNNGIVNFQNWAKIGIGYSF